MKKKPRRRHRPAPDLLAREGAFGKRLRQLEEKVGLVEPSRKIDMAMVFDLPLLPDYEGENSEGTTIGADGTANGCYQLGDHRHVIFLGPRGVTQDKAARQHRQAIVDLMAAHPEYCEPPTPPEPIRVQIRTGLLAPEQLITPN